MNYARLAFEVVRSRIYPVLPPVTHQAYTQAYTRRAVTKAIGAFTALDISLALYGEYKVIFDPEERNKQRAKLDHWDKHFKTNDFAPRGWFW